MSQKGPSGKDCARRDDRRKGGQRAFSAPPGARAKLAWCFAACIDGELCAEVARAIPLAGP